MTEYIIHRGNNYRFVFIRIIPLKDLHGIAFRLRRKQRNTSIGEIDFEVIHITFRLRINQRIFDCLLYYYTLCANKMLNVRILICLLTRLIWFDVIFFLNIFPFFHFSINDI